jgi:NAD(P)-dependent dehydrogenase (short-subunit alcohol dehydrogenase family)
VDVCLISDQGELIEHFRAPVDRDGLYGLTRRVGVYEEPVRGVIESMNGARFVHDELVKHGWEVLIAPASELCDLPRGPGYHITKAALNALTRTPADELRAEGVLVNAVSPGLTATDMGGSAERPIAEGAASIVWGVSLPDDGSTGGSFQDGEQLPWWPALVPRWRLVENEAANALPGQTGRPPSVLACGVLTAPR